MTSWDDTHGCRDGGGARRGPRARIADAKGEVTADDVVINGRIVGRVRGLKVRLTATARVEGDIIHKTIAIESGAHFEGSVQRAEDPLSGLADPDLMPSEVPDLSLDHPWPLSPDDAIRIRLAPIPRTAEHAGSWAAPRADVRSPAAARNTVSGSRGQGSSAARGTSA